MELSIQKLSKAFNQKKVFSNISLEVPAGCRLAVTGSNGSGKSTLLKILSGGALPSSGAVRYSIAGKAIGDEHVYRHVHFVAPYNTVIEELTLPELFRMHQSLGTLKAYTSYDEWVDQLAYKFKATHVIKTFSSGMKQRIKLGLVLLDDRPLILLDEPTSNLDQQGRDWFYGLLAKLTPAQTLILATNEEREAMACTEAIQMERYSA